jgi:hypothetical protein
MCSTVGLAIFGRGKRRYIYEKDAKFYTDLSLTFKRLFTNGCGYHPGNPASRTVFFAVAPCGSKDPGLRGCHPVGGAHAQHGLHPA